MKLETFKRYRTWAVTASVAALFLASVASISQAGNFRDAFTYFEQGKYVEAAAEFRAQLELTPNWRDGHFYLGMCLAKMKKPDLAVEELKKAVDIDNKYFPSVFALSKVYVDQKKYYEAISTLKKIESSLSTDAEKGRYYQMVGYSNQALKKWCEAGEALDKGLPFLKAEANYNDLLLMAGKSNFYCGDYKSAESSLKQLLGNKPSHSEARQYLVKTYLDQEKWDLAIAEAQRAGGDPTTQAALSAALMKTRRYAQAIPVLKRLTEENPTSITHLSNLGRAHIGNKDCKAGVDILLKVIAKDQSQGLVYYDLGNCLNNMNKFKEALPHLQKARKLLPDSAEVCRVLGYAHEQLKEYEDAIKAYETGLSKKPGDSDLSASLTRVKENYQTFLENLEIERRNQEIEEENEMIEEEYGEEIGSEE